MSSTLFVVLASGRPMATGGLQYVLSSDGANILQHGVGTAATLPRADVTVAVIPPEAISWHCAKIPPVSRSRLRATLDGLLEDDLLDEPSSCAMAVSERAAVDGSRIVATTDKSWLINAIAELELDGRAVARCVPQFWPAGDAGEPQLEILNDVNGARSVLVCRRSVVVGPLSAAPVLLRSDELADSGRPVLLDTTLSDTAVPALSCATQPRDSAQRLVAVAASGWELAQFDLSISLRARLLRRWRSAAHAGWNSKHWRAVRWGIVALLVANLVGFNVWAWQIQAQVKTTKGDIEAVFLRAFPGVKTVVNAQLQMERELALLRRTSGSLGATDLEAMLSVLGQALPPGQVATALEFNPGELLVGGLALDATSQASLGAKLAAAGYTTRVAGERLGIVAGGRP